MTVRAPTPQDGTAGGSVAVGVAAFGAARLLRGLLAIAAVPVVAVDRGDLVSANLIVLLALVSLLSVALAVVSPDTQRRELAVAQLILDIVLALAVSSLADAQAMPLVWLALLVPAMTAGEHFGLGTAVATWTAVSFGFAGLSFGFGPNDYSNSDVLRLVLQQVVASVAIVGSVVYVARRNWTAFQQVAADRQVATERLQHLLAIGDTAMRLAEADESETVSRETVSAALQNGFARAELWKREAADWKLLGSGGGLPISDDLVRRLLERPQVPRLAHKETVDSLDGPQSRSLFAAGYTAVVILSVVPPGTDELRLLGYDETEDRGQQQLDSLELIGGHVATAWKKSERIKELDDWSRRLAHEATHDQLTGLPNRAGLFECFRTTPANSEHMILFFDLNGFKEVNDVHGHEAGDALLRGIAERLHDTLIPAGHYVARLGGDEFVVCASLDSTTPDRLCESLITAVEHPVVFDDQLLSVGTSIGVALSSEGSTNEELLRQADTAMYRAKARKDSGSAWALATESPDLHPTARRGGLFGV